MKINFLGDSITEGAGASEKKYCFVSRVGEKLPCEALNYGVGGTRIARQDEGECLEDFNLRALSMDKDADLVFVFGGTNDFGHGTSEMGDMSSKSVYTFYGAVKTLTEYLVNTYGKDKVIFILPIPRFDQDFTNGDGSGRRKEGSPKLYAYLDAIKEVVSFYGVKYLDFSKYFPKAKQGPSDLFFDGLHPNDKGHELLATLISDYVKNKN